MREKYESLAVAVLRDLAKSRGIQGISAMKKADLIEAMLALDEEENKKKSEEKQEEKLEEKQQENLNSVVGHIGRGKINAADFTTADRLRHGIVVIESANKFVSTLQNKDSFFIFVGFHNDAGVNFINDVAHFG